MNQPMNFVWNPEGAEMAKKAGAASGISETGAYEGVITAAIYTFGRDGSKSQALELSFDSNGLKANYLRINFIGKDGQSTFGAGLVYALMFAAGVKKLEPAQVQGEQGPEWHCPSLVNKKVGLFLQKVLYTKTTDGSDGYRFEIRNVFQPGTRKTYAEYSENAPAEDIAALELSMKDKDDRQRTPQHSGPAGGGWGQPVNPYTAQTAAAQNGVPNSRLQQAATQHAAAQNEPPMDFDDDIPFAPLGLQYGRNFIYAIS
ncbi:hypothetical protein [Sodalis sp. dw_96]|uniref:hypothetical protein n=1 Tax=Sodalis sp. dw_96 TaxID=2719794 RepID=UPI001BD31EF5|nr:hypothetical protein [Sodalis sp. dw_96]